MTMGQNFKPILVHDPMPDPNRKNLAAAIALHAGARRDVRVADEAARMAAQRCWDAENRLVELQREGAVPSGAKADAFIASVASGNPCTVAALERSSIESSAQITAAANDYNIWDQTRQECDLSAREKESAVAEAKERVDRSARMVVCGEENVAKLLADLARLQSEIVEKRSALRFISSRGCNGELARPVMEQIERILLQDLSGLGPTDSYRAWAAAFDELLTNSDANLPEIARIA